MILSVFLNPHLVPPVSTAIEALARFPTLVLYVGPDQVMPLMSLLGGIVGMALMFWNKLLDLARRSRALFSRRSRTPRPETID